MFTVLLIMSKSILPGHTVTRYTVVTVQLLTDEIVCTVFKLNGLGRFSNFFQVGTTFISHNVLWTTLLLSPLKANLSFF
jgi:hypothetical protein